MRGVTRRRRVVFGTKRESNLPESDEESALEILMAKLCPACSKANPATADYCYYDGRNLSQQGQAGPLQVGTLPLPRPFYFPDGQYCTNFNQLAVACDARWDEAKGLLADGTWHSFFGTIGRLDLAAVARQAAREPDPDVGLSQLLEKFPADPQTLRPPELVLPSAEENLGALTPGIDHRFDLLISNRGLLVLRGMATTTCEWLSFGDGTVPALKMFQTRGIYALPVRVLGHKLRAGMKPLQGEITIDTNGGALTVPVRADIPVRPFPGGTQPSDVLAGARTPRELAAKAKANPQGAAALFEQGAVKAWYASNGWAYPVEGTQASGKRAVQQFFEALGLAIPPRLEIDTERWRCQGKVGQRDTKHVTISTKESRLVYAQGWSNQPWLTVRPGKSQGNKITLALHIEVPPCPGETLHADVTIQGNGNQKFVVPVSLAVVAPPPVEVEVPTGGFPWKAAVGWTFAGIGVLFFLAIPVAVIALVVSGVKPESIKEWVWGPTTIATPPPPTVPKTEAWWVGMPDTKLPALVSELKGIDPPDAPIFDGIGIKDDLRRREPYEKLAAIVPKLLGDPKTKEPLGQLIAQCCVFDPYGLSLVPLLDALQRQLPGKGIAFRPEENGAELERALWSLHAIFAALNDKTHLAEPLLRGKKLTQALEDGFGVGPDEEAPKDEVEARKLLAKQCYRNTVPTAIGSLDHALTMRGKLIDLFPEYLPPVFRAPIDVDLIAIGLPKGDDAWPKLEPILKTCLESTDPDIKKRLADLQQKADPAVAQKMDALKASLRIVDLTNRLKDPNAKVRLDAAQTLAALESSAREAVPALAAQLRIETVPDVIAELTRALGKIHVATPEAVDALLAKVAQSKVPAGRLQFVQALVNLGPEPPIPLSALFRVMGDDNAEISQCADKAMTARFKTPTPEDLRDAIAALKDGNANVRCQAARALGTSGPAAQDAAPTLTAVLQNEKEPPAVLAAAAGSLGSIGNDSKEVLAALGAKADHPDLPVRRAAFQSLVTLRGDSISLRFLYRFAEDSDPDLKQRAGAALVKRLKSVTKDDLADLRLGLKSKSSPTQRAVAEGLGQLGTAAEAAADDLVPLLSDNVPLVVRQEAAIALVRVNPKHEDAEKKALKYVVTAFGVQADEKVDGEERMGRCARARKAAVALGKPAAHALVKAIYAGEFTPNKAPQIKARLEVYRTLEELGPAAKDDARELAEQVGIDKNYPDLRDVGKRALDANSK